MSNEQPAKTNKQRANSKRFNLSDLAVLQDHFFGLILQQTPSQNYTSSYVNSF